MPENGLCLTDDCPGDECTASRSNSLISRRPRNQSRIIMVFSGQRVKEIAYNKGGRGVNKKLTADARADVGYPDGGSR